MPSNLLYLDIVDEFEKKIQGGVYQVGDKSPSERDLANQFRVSRNVIREAIKALNQKGLIDIFPGRGAFVKKIDPFMVTDTLRRVISQYDTSLEEIIEVREELEKAILKRAVKHASIEQIANLKEVYRQMEQTKDNVNNFVKHDELFHKKLAECAKNNIFSILVHSFSDMTKRSLFSITLITKESVMIAQEQHLAMIEAIEERNEEKALMTVEAHMKVLRAEIQELEKRNLL